MMLGALFALMWSGRSQNFIAIWSSWRALHHDDADGGVGTECFGCHHLQVQQRSWLPQILPRRTPPFLRAGRRRHRLGWVLGLQ
jgi:hypothetical protein